MIKDGNYEGRAIKGKVQLGESAGGGLQMAIDMELFDVQNNSIGQMTTFLYFTEGAAVYAYERLRLLGWKGEGPQDLVGKLDGIYTNRVPVRVTAPEKYRDSTGMEKMGSSKLEIVTGGGTVTISKPLDPATFQARLMALGGTSGTSSGGSSSGGTTPPF